MPAQPQDHKPAKGKQFTFFGQDGKKYSLPPASAGRANLAGEYLFNAMVGSEVDQSQYMFRLLKAAEPEPEALSALLALPEPKMLEVIGAWGDHGDGDGASLGE